MDTDARTLPVAKLVRLSEPVKPVRPSEAQLARSSGTWPVHPFALSDEQQEREARGSRLTGPARYAGAQGILRGSTSA
ncbi:hypothetical protein ACIBQ1_56645 [Nonomuraea sp. NPDC050153]|uniref:hypothetical protein n=1 Tax=Nonomuraea sp. NPDC050153 TaxID=3364359 RepID=UPI00378F8FD4